jgi:hypothetical protein
MFLWFNDPYKSMKSKELLQMLQNIEYKYPESKVVEIRKYDANGKIAFTTYVERDTGEIKGDDFDIDASADPEMGIELVFSDDFHCNKGADFNNDGKVDMDDLSVISNIWKKCSGDEGFNSDVDFDRDGCVSGIDMYCFSKKWNP